MNPRLYLALGLSFSVAAFGGLLGITPALDKQAQDTIINALDHNIDADLRAAVDAEIKKRGLKPPAP